MKNQISEHASYVYFIGFIAALAGLLFGFDTGIISGAIAFIKQEYHLSTEIEGLVVSSVLIGAVCGTLLSNFILTLPFSLILLRSLYVRAECLTI